MKKVYAMLLLAMSFSSFSQVWIDQNATWHYDYWGVAEEGFFKLEYNQDSLINGENCQVIESYQSKFVTDQFGQMHHIGPTLKSTNFTYVNGDTVFYWKDDQFFTLFDFGASIGDQWQIGSTNSNGDPVCDDSSFVVVVDTGTVIINSNSYRTISLETTAGSSLRFGGVFVERFGQIGSNYGFHTFPGVETCDTNVITEYYGITFKCFEDDSFTLYNPSGEDCEYLLTHLSNEEIAVQKLASFPNPVSEMLKVQMNGEGVLELYNQIGQVVIQQNHYNQSVIEMEAVPTGIYLLRLRIGESVYTEKILKH
ncbi:MAG: T9SS type A sorting domain-containing protein [Crocinitomicaceae bacterium]